MSEVEIDFINSDGTKLREVDAETVRELAASIKTKGLQQPICVRKSTEGYMVIFGEHRLAACRLLGLKKISCIVRECGEEEALEVKLIENIHRNVKLNPIKEGEIFKRLLQSRYKTVNELGEAIGKSSVYVNERISLFYQLDDSIKPLLGEKIGIRTAIAISKIPTKERQKKFLERLLKLEPADQRIRKGTGLSQPEYAEKHCICPECGNRHNKLGSPRYENEITARKHADWEALQ